ncbi:MAG: DUF3300 domain-containing protein [Phycisphaerales bacterium]
MQHFTPRLLAALCVMACGVNCPGQAPPKAPPPSAGTTRPAPASTASTPSTASKLTKADLEEMLAPIALYPDTLLASTLAACVYEEDFKAAAKFVAGGGKVDATTTKDWDASVLAIASFPEVIGLLGANPEWAVAVGQAYLVQGADVMAAAQSLRARAWANGALQTTPQQTVVTEGQTIVIEPAKPEVIYVPSYNPSVVYVDDDDDEVVAGVIGFGLGITTGLILANNMDCYWHSGCVGWGHGGNQININGDVNIGNSNNINNIGSGNTNIGNGSGNRPAQGGSKWQPNQARMSPGATSGAALNNYKGVGGGTSAGGAAANAKVPGRTAGAKPIASGKAPPAPKPKPANTARPSSPTARPSAGPSAAPSARPSGTPAARPSSPPAPRPATPAARPATPSSRPSTPAASPASRPSTPAARPAPAPAPRSSGFNPSGGGGSRSASGGSRGGSRGGGGGRGGGRR